MKRYFLRKLYLEAFSVTGWRLGMKMHWILIPDELFYCYKYKFMSGPVFMAWLSHSYNLQAKKMVLHIFPCNVSRKMSIVQEQDGRC